MSLPVSPLNKSDVLNKSILPDLPQIANVNSGLTSKTNSMYGSDINIDINSEEDPQEFDGLIYKDTTNSTNTLHMLNVLRKNRQLCDLILQLDDDAQDIYCHQLILACNSKFFMEIFNSVQDESPVVAPTTPTDIDDENKNGNGHGEKKESLKSFINKNHGANQKQILFCLSAYLRNFLSGSHHHYAKINSIVNHNNHAYQKASGSHCGIDMTQGAVLDDESVNHINQNLDCQALKICIDYMYTSKLKVPIHLLPHVYTLAYHLSIDSIVTVCAQHLTRMLNVDNCLTIRSFALDENLIEASSECIERNIEYILQIKPTPILNSRGSVSSSLSSLTNSSYSKLGSYDNTSDITKSCSTLSSSLNLANKEFNQLPRIRVELVGLKKHKLKLPESVDVLTEMCMSWLVKELLVNEKDGEKSNDVASLCDNLNMLYINEIDATLHDCCDMETIDTNFDDYIDDYQKQRNLLNLENNDIDYASRKPIQKKIKKVKKAAGMKPSPGGANSRLKTFTLTDQDFINIGSATPIKLNILHDNEVIVSRQTGENSLMAIVTLEGKLVTLSVHLRCVKAHTCSTEDEIFNGGFLNGVNGEFNENGMGCGEFRGRINSNKSETPSELSLEIDTQDPNLLTTTTTNNNNNNLTPTNPNTRSPLILYNRTLSSSSTLDSEKIPRMSVARASHGVIAFENRLFIMGGYDRGECLNQCECYDPQTNTMTQMACMGQRRGRAAITYFEKENSVYVMGGSNGLQDLNSIESYDMVSKQWKCKEFDFDLACSNLASTACEKYIYLVGLKNESKKSLKHTSCLKYEPKLNQFTCMSELNQARSQAALVCTSLNKTDLLFVFGGHDQIRCLNSCEVYNLADDKWTVMASMHEAKRGCGAAAHHESSMVFIVGGTNGSQSLKTVEVYNVIMQRWTRGPELNIARTNVAIAFIGNNLFAVGGYDGKSFLRSIECLNIKNMDAGWSLFHRPHDFINQQ